MEKLRIHKTKYRNRGMANKKLKGQNEHHVIFKFNTDEMASEFIAKVKEWYYGTEKVGDKVSTTLNKPNEVKEPIKKKPGLQKGKGGRPVKKNLQGQSR